MDSRLRDAMRRGDEEEIRRQMMRAGLMHNISSKVANLKATILKVHKMQLPTNIAWMTTLSRQTARNLQTYWWRNQPEDWTLESDGLVEWMMLDVFDPGYYYIRNCAMWCAPESAWESYCIPVDDR